MADNYLEKRYEELFSSKSAQHTPLRKPGLGHLLRKNRSYRAYDPTYKLHPLQISAILGVNSMIASGRNAQTLRFHVSTEENEVCAILSQVGIGGGLPELHLPFPGTEPAAFIIVCSTLPESPIIDIDLGISLQSMLLKAVDLGFGGLIIRNFKPEALRQALNLPLTPLAVLALGKPAEKIELVEAKPGDNLNYYRKDGVHYVPKLSIEDMMI